ncbi:MAG: SDR family oxidoreductase, partial [Myxococcales bacterium]
MKTALITGCSSGYGHATAARFLERGWNVVATMRSPQTGLFAPSERLRVVALDVTRPDSIASAVGEGIAAFGQLDVVVNNAGVGLMSALEVTPLETIRRVFETNTFGVMAVTQAVIPHLRERRAGTIINVTSSVGIVPMPLVSAYCASKYAVEGFSESLAYELALFGVRVRIVQPGYGPTTRFAANGGPLDGLLPGAYQAYAAQLLGSLQSGVHTTEAQVAEVVLAAADDPGDRLRYPAGPDSEQLAALRRAGPDAYLDQMRVMLGPR